MIILGIDPGSRCTGYGLIDNQPNRITYMNSGFFKIQGDNIAQRLGQIFQHIDDLIRQYQPQQMSIERVFMHRNADSALKLGQARGAAICAAHLAGLEIAEYAPREIKQAIVGTGSATKDQVQHMVRRLLSLRQPLQADESDGLAIAICHAQFYATQQKIGLDPKLLKRRRSRRR
ncbi:MAG: crossover junction endodeoxyribonuclease RuvC [Gammaproteobacteria bacterium]|nr:crossover junction endodeoxyribonuclease RuvC [Gammaproteobacteria bacterium]MCZ6667958.1 crossover junction endodeoxyribonuclease RuvC [Gammaproteobacteria bacterium]MCZ6882246.1 crossover junction endodeoxyribonuclease RuvC [Gammaproteobacteria bacterium]